MSKRKFVKWKGYRGPKPPDPEIKAPRNFYRKEDPKAHLKATALLSKALDNGCADNEPERPKTPKVHFENNDTSRGTPRSYGG